MPPDRPSPMVSASARRSWRAERKSRLSKRLPNIEGSGLRSPAVLQHRASTRQRQRLHAGRERLLQKTPGQQNEEDGSGCDGQKEYPVLFGEEGNVKPVSYTHLTLPTN